MNYLPWIAGRPAVDVNVIRSVWAASLTPAGGVGEGTGFPDGRGVILSGTVRVALSAGAATAAEDGEARFGFRGTLVPQAATRRARPMGR